VNAAPPAFAELGLRLVRASGAATVLKFASTSVSPSAVRLAGFAFPVTSFVQPPNSHPVPWTVTDFAIDYDVMPLSSKNALDVLHFAEALKAAAY
jgi:hypothetical protein